MDLVWTVTGHAPICLTAASDAADAYRLVTANLTAAVVEVGDGLFGVGQFDRHVPEPSEVITISSAPASSRMTPQRYRTGVATLQRPRGITARALRRAVFLAALDDSAVRQFDATWSGRCHLTVGVMVTLPHDVDLTIERLIRRAETMLGSGM